MSYNVNSLVLHAVGEPTWLPDGRMWYRDAGPNGYTFMLVDPVKGTKGPAFDQVKMAAALKALSGNTADVDPYQLPLAAFTLSNNDQTVTTTAAGRRISCDLSGVGICTSDDSTPQAGRRRRRGPGGGGVDISPDGTKAAFIRDWNLWVRDTATGNETQLTTDGVKDYGYATDNAGWTHSDSPILVWSPDSKTIATFQQDQRKTGEMYLTNVTAGHPSSHAEVPARRRQRRHHDRARRHRRRPAAKVVRLKMPPDQHRSTLCDDISCRGGSGWDDVQWAADANTLAFVSTSRDHKQEWLRVADPDTGDVREVMDETVAKFFESGNDKVNWHYLSASNEFLWFSERDNWGQLYLYDLATGKLKNQITHGDGTSPRSSTSTRKPASSTSSA